MKTVVLCGGLGTRLSEETTVKPKPMVEIGTRPILWHVMQIYQSYGFEDFALALGYKGEIIKEYFLNYHARCSDITVNISNGQVEYLTRRSENWRIDLIDTGERTLTGGRLLRLKDRMRGSGTFMVTYGDGVADVDIKKLVEYHKRHGKVATVTAVRPSARFGGVTIDNGQVVRFEEKPQSGEGWINGGFFVFEPAVFNYLIDDFTVLEREPLENLVREGQLMAYQHSGFWQCMDTVRDKDVLQSLWNNGKAPWLK